MVGRAGPGRREALGLDAGGDTARFRFHPGAPVPHVGLLASRFERRAMNVAGVELEILVHPKHDRNLRFFEDAAEEIENRVGEIFTDAAKLGLPYPYGGLTLVESPNILRGYGGGWRMDTTQAMPGVLLLRENSFTTSRFEFEFRNPDSFAERDGGIARAKVEAIERFFENDFSGGNVFLGGSRNFLRFQTGARGEGAVAIDFVIDELVNQLLTGKRGYFSAFLLDPRSALVLGETLVAMVSGRMDSIAEALLDAAADRPSVWDRALGVSMADLEPTDDPRQSLNVLALKGRAIARSILDGLGREKTAALLAELLARYRGGHFTAADLEQVAAELGADLDPLIGDWLHEASLPGFVTSPVVVERLADDEQGIPRYQTRVHVLNDEATPGLFRVRYATRQDGASVTRWDQTEPVRLAGHEALEIGVLSSMPPRELWLQPYLSLNRQDVQLTLPRVDQEEQVRVEPFLGGRPSTWRPAETTDIVVDDLDPGFSVEVDEEEEFGLAASLAGAFIQIDMDQGLPASNEFLPTENGGWSRRELSASWGKYRHTIALVGRGGGTRRAVFTADLPHAGRWRLAYHLPVLTRQRREVSGPGIQINAQIGLGGSLGTYDLTVRAGGEERALEFDGAAAEAGWNVLGEFDVPKGTARGSRCPTGHRVVWSSPTPYAGSWSPRTDSMRHRDAGTRPQVRFGIDVSRVLSLLTLGCLGCGAASETAPVEFRIPVEVAEVTTDVVEDRIVTTGTLRTQENVVLNVETPGFLVLGRDETGARLVEGSTVTKGQLVAEITGEDARLAAGVEATRRRLENAEGEMKRRQMLFDRGLIPEEEARRAEVTYEDALLSFEQSQLRNEKMQLTTPLAGVVLELARDETGFPVADGQMVNPGFEVARIAPIGRLVADIDLVGPELARVRPGQTVQIRHYAFDGINDRRHGPAAVSHRGSADTHVPPPRSMSTTRSGSCGPVCSWRQRSSSSVEPGYPSCRGTPSPSAPAAASSSSSTASVPCVVTFPSASATTSRSRCETASSRASGWSFEGSRR